MNVLIPLHYSVINMTLYVYVEHVLSTVSVFWQSFKNMYFSEACDFLIILKLNILIAVVQNKLYPRVFV